MNSTGRVRPRQSRSPDLRKPAKPAQAAHAADKIRPVQLSRLNTLSPSGEALNFSRLQGRADFDRSGFAPASFGDVSRPFVRLMTDLDVTVIKADRRGGYSQLRNLAIDFKSMRKTKGEIAAFNALLARNGLEATIVPSERALYVYPAVHAEAHGMVTVRTTLDVSG